AGRTVRAPDPHLRRPFHRLSWNERPALRGSRRTGLLCRQCGWDVQRDGVEGERNPAGIGRPSGVRDLRRQRDPRRDRQDRRCRSLPDRRDRARRQPRQASGPRGRTFAFDRRAYPVRARAHPRLRERMAGDVMTKTINQKAWLFVIPVVVLVAFNAIIPLMTVVNYSVQESFGENTFFWAGVRWFEELLSSERFHASLLRSVMFTAIIL